MKRLTLLLLAILLLVGCVERRDHNDPPERDGPVARAVHSLDWTLTRFIYDVDAASSKHYECEEGKDVGTPWDIPEWCVEVTVPPPYWEK